MPWIQWSAGSTISQVRSNGQVQQGATVAMEKSKEYGTKGWGFLRGVYANVANQVESVASEHGYRVDLGAAQPPSLMLAIEHSSMHRPCFLYRPCVATRFPFVSKSACNCRLLCHSEQSKLRIAMFRNDRTKRRCGFNDLRPGAKGLQDGSRASSSGMNGRASSQPQLHTGMEGLSMSGHGDFQGPHHSPASDSHNSNHNGSSTNGRLNGRSVQPSASSQSFAGFEGVEVECSTL